MEKTIPSVSKIQVYYGDEYLFDYWRNMANASKILICPWCLRKKMLIRNSEMGEFYYDANHDPFENDELEARILNESNFIEHTTNCASLFSCDGIHKTTTEELQHLASRMNFVSKMETSYHSISIEESTYIYVLNGKPISYIAYDPSFIRKKSDREWILKDVFTFPKYRKKGYGSQLFEYAIKDLNLDVTALNISFPISNLGKHLILKYAKGKIYDIGITPCTYELEFLKKNWDDIMSMG